MVLQGSPGQLGALCSQTLGFVDSRGPRSVGSHRLMTADLLIELRCLVWPQILFPDPPPLLPEWVNHMCLGGNSPSKNISKGQTDLHPGPTDK